MSQEGSPTNAKGPKGFARVTAAIRGFFAGSGNTVPTGQNFGGVKAVPAAVVYARAASQDPKHMSRMELSEKKQDMYEQSFLEHVQAKMREGFHPENYARLCFNWHTSSNLLVRVTRELSILYQEPAKRSLEEKKKAVQAQGGAVDEGGTPASLELAGEEPPAAGKPVLDTGDAEVDALAEVLDATPAQDEAQETPFDKLMRAVDWDTWLDTVEVLCRIHPVVWLRPIVVGELDAAGQLSSDKSRLSFVIYTPAVADVEPDDADPTRAKAFWYWGEEVDETTGQLRRVIHHYTADSYQKLDAHWKVLESQPNRLGRLPVTQFSLAHPINGYYPDGVGNALYDGTLELCCLKTLQNQRGKDGAFKQLAISGDASSVPADQVMGGPTPIFLGDEGQAAVLDLQANLQYFTDLCKERRRELAEDYGVDVTESESSGVQSGYAKKLKMAKVLKESKRSRKFFAVGEKDLYANVAKTLEVFPVDAIGKLDPEAELCVDFGEPQFDEDPEKQANTDARRLKMNLDSIIDVMARDNPDLTEEELVRRAHRNKRLNETLMTQDQMRLVDLLASAAAKPGGQPGGAHGDGGDGQVVDGEVTRKGLPPGANAGE